MITQYARCVLPVDSEYLLEGGKMEIQIQCSGPNGEVLVDGPTFLIGPGDLLKISDNALAFDTLMAQRQGLGGAPMFEQVMPDPPAPVDVDVDALISALIG